MVNTIHYLSIRPNEEHLSFLDNVIKTAAGIKEESRFMYQQREDNYADLSLEIWKRICILEGRAYATNLVGEPAMTYPEILRLLRASGFLASSEHPDSPEELKIIAGNLEDKFAEFYESLWKRIKYIDETCETSFMDSCRELRSLSTKIDGGSLITEDLDTGRDTPDLICATFEKAAIFVLSHGSVGRQLTRPVLADSGDQGGLAVREFCKSVKYAVHTAPEGSLKILVSKKGGESEAPTQEGIVTYHSEAKEFHFS